MANVAATNNWSNDVYQFETEDVLEGGPNGIDNVPSIQLASRTNWLRLLIEAVCTSQSIPLVNTQTSQLLTAINALVAAQVNALIAGAPNALNTLDELAAALGDDANYAATITTALAAKAPLASPALTGTPSAPTAALGTNTTQIATAAFVQAAITALVNAAPSTLNTLGELAAAINNDPTYHATITSALAAKAPLASPALTGTPTAPTAALGTNTTQIATAAFVQAAISALVDSSPAALNTLNELAAALGDDPNFATTITNALAAKAPLASPTFTGTPSVPTAAAGTNTTQAASTAFVQAAIALISNVAASTTVMGIVELATNAEAQALTDAARCLTPSTLKAAFQGANQVISASGYQKLPGGLILMWGRTGSIPAASAQTYTFPITFPTANLMTLAFRNEQSSTAQRSDAVDSYTTSNASINNGSPSSAAIFSVFALGY